MKHATTAGAEHDVVEFLYTLQRTLVLQVVLVGIARLLTQCTYSRHETLSANGRKDFFGGESVLCHHVRLQPDTQSVGVTQTKHVTYTCDTHQARLDVDIDIVGNKVFVILAVNTLYSENLQDVVLTLLHLHTDFVYVGWQQRLRTAHAVLHVHSCEVGICTLLEIHVNLHITIRRSLRGDIGHVGYAIDCTLQRLDNRFHNRILISTRIAGGDLHRRWRNVGVLFYWQGAHRDITHQRNHNRDGTRHHVFIDKYIILHKEEANYSLFIFSLP